MATNKSVPGLIDGGLHVDTRGTVAFVNDFNFKGVDRAYIIRCHQSREPRGWVGHKLEQKWFWVVQGTVLIAVVEPDNWERPASNLPVKRFVLSYAKPQVLHVPAGNATASIILSENSILMVFSTGNIENSKEDDYRFPVDTWSIIDSNK